MVRTRYCSKHPRVNAGWACSTCAADWCPDCVATSTLGHRQSPVDLCCQCRHGVSAITVHRAELVPLWQRLLDAPKYPLGSVGLLSLAFLAFVRALTSYVGFMSMLTMGAAMFLLRVGLYWAFVFFIIRNSAEGARKMGVLGFRDIQSDVVAPALKGLLATALLWLPAAIYIVAVSDEGVTGILSYEGTKDPLVWLLALLGITYAPMALLAAATDLGVGHILNPVQIFRSVRRMGRDYVVAIAAVAVVLIVGRILEQGVGLVIAKIDFPFLPRWLSEVVTLYPTFVAARVLGTLLFTRGEALDWGREEDYLVPVLAGVRPRGVLPEKASPREQAVALPASAPAPERKLSPRSIPVFDPQVGSLSSEDEAAQAEPRIELAREPAVERPAPVEGLPAPSAPAAGSEASSALVRAVDAGRMDEALHLYRELPGEDEAIPARVHMAVGRQASKVRDFDVAAYAFRQVAFTQSEHAGAALVALAQVLGDGRRDAVAAERVYREAISRFPGTDVAAFAERKLTASRAG